MKRLSLCLLCAACSQTLDGGGQTGAGVYWGTPEPNEPGVGFLTGSPGCTGVLVSSRVMLTADHCVRDYPPMELVLGYKRDGDRYAVVRTRALGVRASGVHEFPDLGVVELDAEVQAPPYALGGAPQVGDKLKVVGYGTREDGGSGWKYSGVTTVTVVGPAAYQGDEVEDTEFVTEGGPNTPDGGANSCYGDSGGPLLSASGAIIGTVSRDLHGHGCGQYDVNSRVDVAFAQIRQFMDEADCGCGRTLKCTGLSTSACCYADQTCAWSDDKRTASCAGPSACDGFTCGRGERCVVGGDGKPACCKPPPT